MNEVSGNEVKEAKALSEESYRDIKPTTGSSFADSVKYWVQEHSHYRQEYSKAQNDSEKLKKYTDDNGKKYRDQDGLNPNTKYEINGYKYETDKKGRITKAEGKLYLGDHESNRNMETIKDSESKGYKKDDERGHLIGHQFGGSDKLDNLVPMNGDLNRRDYAKLENALADAVKDGAKVYLRVEPRYDADSNRPTEFKVSYSINGDRKTIVFKNEGRDQR